MNHPRPAAVFRPLRNLTLTVFCLLPGLREASAQTTTVPVLMSYQGRVTDASGVLIGNSAPVNRTVAFRLYTASSGGSAIWGETQTATISAGEFSVLIGNGTGISGTPGPSAPSTTLRTLADILNALTNATVYLGITVDDGNASTTDLEIAPRQQLVSGAFSLRARVAETVAGGAVTTTMLADSSVTTNQISAGAVNTAKLGDSSVSTAKLINASINTDKLADVSVTTAKLVNGSVTSDKILDSTILNADIANGAINGAKILDATITGADIAAGTITTGNLAANSVDLGKLVTSVQQALCPTGTISAYAGDNAPDGWLICNGSSISRSTYSTLYSVVGNRFGTADGNTFNIPDFRGRFLRGRDNGVGRDEDRASRTAMFTGGSTGDNVGSVQADMLKAHKHSVPRDSYGSVDNLSLTGTNGSDEDFSDTPGTGTTGGSETRPENANVNYIIKY